MNEQPKKNVKLSPPLPKAAGNQIGYFNVQVLTIAALLTGPVPPGVELRSKAYLDKLDEARKFAFEYLGLSVKEALSAKLVLEDPRRGPPPEFSS